MHTLGDGRVRGWCCLTGGQRFSCRLRPLFMPTAARGWPRTGGASWPGVRLSTLKSPRSMRCVFEQGAIRAMGLLYGDYVWPHQHPERTTSSCLERRPRSNHFRYRLLVTLHGPGPMPQGAGGDKRGVRRVVRIDVQEGRNGKDKHNSPGPRTHCTSATSPAKGLRRA